MMMLPSETNIIQDITHSPLYPLVLLTVYIFAIGFTIGNYVGYFRFNTAVYGESLVRAYLAFTILGCAAFFFICGPAWLWAAKYVTSMESRIRKLTVGFLFIFLLHDLPCFSIELHAILEYGWRNGYQGFVFVVQILTFLLSFINAWLYFTWVMAGWCQFWYGNPMETYTLKTGAEEINILPPMSPAEKPVLITPMLGDGLRWNNGGNSGNRQIQQQQRGPSMMMSSGGGNYSSRAGSPRSGDRRGYETPVSVQVPDSAARRMSATRVASPYNQSQQGSGLRGNNNNFSQPPPAINRTVEPVNFVDGLDECNPQCHDDTPPSRAESVASSAAVAGGVIFKSNQTRPAFNQDPFHGGPPASLMTSVSGSPRTNMNQRQQNQNYSSNRGAGGIRPLELSRSPSTNSGSWRNIPVVDQTNAGGPVIWNDRRAIL